MTGVDFTHGADLQSWVGSANDPATDFPIQNLPFGRFKEPGDSAWRIGVAIGREILDLQAAGLTDHADMVRLMDQPVAARKKLRQALSVGLHVGSTRRAVFEAALHCQDQVTLGLPCDVDNYTDFYSSLHHATAIGKQVRPDTPLPPNYKWMPIGYHGRASSIVPSGTPFHRPTGQTKAPDAATPSFGPCQRLDHELELGVVIARPNALGEPVAMKDAEAQVFGIALFNDWSARDIQGWEYQPLGPFLAKNFASTLSPWVVTLEALAPFRTAFSRPEGDPQPLAYLQSEANRAMGGVNIALEVWLQTPAMQAAGHMGDCVSTSNYRDAYWTVAQLVAHHTINGCNLRPGDLLGTGTVSGPGARQGGSMMELSAGGKRPLVLSTGEIRAWLQDGDTVTLRGCCQQPGFRRIGFGECTGTVLPAKPWVLTV